MNRPTTNRLLLTAAALALLLGTLASGHALAEYAAPLTGMETTMTHNPDRPATASRKHGGAQCHSKKGHHARRMGGGPAVHPDNLTHHLTAMENKLAITPEQEAAWTDYARKRMEQNDLKAALHNEKHSVDRRDPVAWEGARIDAMERMLTQKMAVLQAYKTLYAQLDEEQKEMIVARQHRRHRQ
ncbi:MAG: Spy/CpxP family protein refolding chaperone [Magnetococcus sp. YQC-3]